MTNHTPGPWHFDWSEKDDYAEISSLISGGTVRVFTSPDLLKIGSVNGDYNTQEGEANARLIAAAPDLLEAAKQIIWKLSHNYSENGSGSDCIPGRIDRRDATIKMLETAIAKAEGK